MSEMELDRRGTRVSVPPVEDGGHDAAAGSMPPPAPVPMTPQPVRGVRRRAPLERAGGRVIIARIVAFGGAVAATAWATSVLWRTLAEAESGALGSGFAWLQVVFVSLFAATFGWIAFSALGTLAGLLDGLLQRWGGGATLPWPEGDPDGPVALVMPVYNEDPAETSAGLLAMAEGLIREGAGDSFEIVILSDTNEPRAWTRETAAVYELRARLAGRMRVWYRRRTRNTARKSGNVEQFVRTWGGRYPYFVMLDADSLMEPRTLITMARRMAGNPALGLLQSVPALAGARAPLPLLQQFASRVFGAPISKGVAAWQGADGNYWGHNAAIRSCAFAGACGLPVLSGRAPFGGPILSHDFAEAAWMRRAGWSVRMDPDLSGSYESGPPTLLDVAVRDRRWMQGNFQHGKIVGGSGLAPVSRVHLASGIVGYLSSPLWLAMMISGSLLGLRASALEHRFFDEPYQLQPHWPVFDSAALLGLFGLSMGLLFFPKFVGLASQLWWRRSGGVGGAVQLMSAAALEALVTCLMAPIVMLMHTRMALDIVRGRDSGWSAQNREGEANRWRDVGKAHVGHTALGAAVAVAGFTHAPAMTLWLSPVIVGLVLSIPLSRLSGDPWLGEWLRNSWLFAALGGGGDPVIAQERDRLAQEIRERIPGSAGRGAAGLLLDRRGARAHFVGVAPGAPSWRGAPDMEALGAAAKVQEARTQEELLSWLDPREELALLSDPELFGRAATLAKGPAGSAPAPTSEPQAVPTPLASPWSWLKQHTKRPSRSA